MRPQLVAAPSGYAWRDFARFHGPGYLAAVGYMDPGNWATDRAASPVHGYRLLWVVGTARAMLMQVMASRLCLISGKNLAQAS
ncbi:MULTISPECIES: hypothetical protein [unclassified Cupriavidus]|uniref:hypothetical protein n=1 Tax=Cupriavidus sp. L7L TaxID=2546443 RepID=UPI00189C55AC|nr:hypothetical protein [Cupriavidus sp. IK-TO18]